jgi:hypothetical protein
MAAILATGNSFSTGDQVTAAALNAAVNASTFASGAVDNTTTQVSGTAIIVKDAGITTAKLDSGGIAPTITGGSITGITDLALADGGTGSSTAVLARAVLNKGETAITDAATIATDASLGNVFTCTLAGNRTLGAPTNVAAGATYIWKFTQDGTGSRTLAYNAVFKSPSGTAPTLTTTAAAIDIISGVSNGTNVYCTAILDVR